jgi:hypothetical protein
MKIGWTTWMYKKKVRRFDADALRVHLPTFPSQQYRQAAIATAPAFPE